MAFRRLKRTMTDSQLNTELHIIAVAQARSLAKQANVFANQFDDSTSFADLLAYLVSAGIAIELYFKALMIAARNGRVTKGHNLLKLYSEFPDFLKKSMERCYHSDARKDRPFRVYGFTQSSTRPETPEKSTSDKSYGSFEEAVGSISDIFVRSRYFFERVTPSDYVYFGFPRQQIEAIVYALDNTYIHFMSGGFRGANS